MLRRRFLQTASAAGLAASILPLRTVKAAPQTAFTSLISNDSDRVLVLIQLFGGNDGLSTVIPRNQYAELNAVRGNILLPESAILPVTDTLGFHPRLTGLRDMFNDGMLTVIQNVGYPDYNRSHFRSTDIWNTGGDASNQLTTGWLGRYFEGEMPGFPAGYPNASNPHPVAVSIGKLTHPTCEGPIVSFGQSVDSNPRFTQVGEDDGAPLPSDNFGREMEYLRIMAEQTNEYGDAIETAYNAGGNSVSYPSGKLASQLRTVARLIDGGLQTSVYTVRLNGFDNHADQVSGNSTNGKHPRLLDELSKAITAFNQDLALRGHQDRVLGLTYSEFGRRIRSNDSRGTDHGAANSMFLFGPCLQQQVLGNDPVIDTQVSQSAALPMEYDYRDIYGSVLKDWFGVSDARIRDILYPNYTYIPIAGMCGRSLPVEMYEFTVEPEGENAVLSWKTAEEYDNRGFEIERSLDGVNFSYLKWAPSKSISREAVNSYEVMDGPLPQSSTYYYRLKAVAVDGEVTFSPIRSVTLSGEKGVAWNIGSAYPNPARGEVFFDCYAPSDDSIAYSVFDKSGRPVASDSATVYGLRTNRIRIGLQRLPAGTYTARFNTYGKGEFSRRFIVQE